MEKRDINANSSESKQVLEAILSLHEVLEQTNRILLNQSKTDYELQKTLEENISFTLYKLNTTVEKHIVPQIKEVHNTIEEHSSPEHKIDPGMVEVSLALAALVFTVSALISGTIPDQIRYLLSVLVVLSNVTAFGFLSRYCFENGVITNIYSLITAFTREGGELYWLLSISLILTTIMYFVIIFAV